MSMEKTSVMHYYLTFKNYEGVRVPGCRPRGGPNTIFIMESLTLQTPQSKIRG
jgi:hypothetical protein